jgi:hypothetical protein
MTIGHHRTNGGFELVFDRELHDSFMNMVRTHRLAT